MTRILRPLEIFTKTELTTCLWLNGSSSASRTVWIKLWNNAARRFITDGGANKVMRRHDLKKPDIISGDMDSIFPAILQEAKELNVRIIETPDQDETDFTKALKIIGEESTELRIEQIVVLGGLSGRFDHTMATLNSLLRAWSLMDRPVIVLDGENLTCVLPEGSTSIVLDRSLLTGKCGVIPFCQQNTIVTMEGFRWNLKNEELKFGGLISTSNEVEEKKLQIVSTAPVIFTLEICEKFLAT